MAKKQTKSKKNLTATKVRIGSYDFEVSFKSYEQLSRFINDRGRIYPRKRTGLTSREQRALSSEIKRARHLGLLPFKPNM